MTRRSLLRRLGLLTGAVVCAPLLPLAPPAITPAMAAAMAAPSTMFAPHVGIGIRFIKTWDCETWDGGVRMRASRFDAFLAQPWMED